MIFNFLMHFTGIFSSSQVQGKDQNLSFGRKQNNKVTVWLTVWLASPAVVFLAGFCFGLRIKTN
jgi:hypothetical protein